jgi:hypothetical protein
MGAVLPAEFHRLRQTLPEHVRFGSSYLHLYSINDLATEQRGYSVGPKGEPLTGRDAGDWKATWLVIGNVEGPGDPVFVDTADGRLPVFTAAHGQGTWSPVLLAASLAEFASRLEIVPELRGHPRSPPKEQDLWELLDEL